MAETKSKIRKERLHLELTAETNQILESLKAPSGQNMADILKVGLMGCSAEMTASPACYARTPAEPDS